VDGGSVQRLLGLTVMRPAQENQPSRLGVSVVIGAAEAGKGNCHRPTRKIATSLQGNCHRLFQFVTGRVWKGSVFGDARGCTDVAKSLSVHRSDANLVHATVLRSYRFFG
jgi:Zn-dependent alcohol dehydrogenase